MSGGGGGRKGGGEWPDRSANRFFFPFPKTEFSARDSRNTPPKKETGVFKTFYKRWEQSNRCFDIHLFFKAYFFHPNRFFFNRRGLIFFREERATGIFSQPLTHPPTCLPAPSPSPPSLLTRRRRKRGGGGEPLLPGLAGGVHQCGPGRRTPSHYFSTRTVAAAASRNT
jgi:hypothetical protein